MALPPDPRDPGWWVSEHFPGEYSSPLVRAHLPSCPRPLESPWELKCSLRPGTAAARSTRAASSRWRVLRTPMCAAARRSSINGCRSAV